MSEERIRLAFCGFHPDRTRTLVERWGSPGAVVAAVERGKIQTSLRVQESIVRPVSELVAELGRLGCRIVLRDDPSYPPRLAAHPDAPDALFVVGVLPAAAGIAVVGTRRCTSYGRRVAREYGIAIARAGWPLVSGLARGIDGAAHEGTVAAHGRGVAVLGCGIDVHYPPEHRPLRTRLIELGGAVVSEYPPGTPPEGWRFPPRNRVISALSAAVVVVEAGVAGGALITAGIAAEQGIPVLATPGDIEREVSRGTNLLIRDGALPVLDPEDLIEELRLLVGEPPTTSPGREGVAVAGDGG